MQNTFTRVFFSLLCFFFLEEAFSQCGTTPCVTPVPSTNAQNACILPSQDNLNCYFGETTTDPPVSLPPSWCSSIQNNHVFAFTATSPDVTFVMAALDCTSGSSLQAAILSSADCINFQFVSACFGDIPTGTTAVITANGLNVGEVYFLMIDGSSGATCEYSINASSAITSGPTTACIPASAIANYTTTEPSDWTINPPGMGTFIGSTTGTSATVEWTQQGTAQICTQTLSCPGTPPLCIEVTIGSSTGSTSSAILCDGESVVCGGTTYTQPGTYVSNLTGWTGCDSLVTCTITEVPTYNQPLTQVTLCGPAQYSICGSNYTGTEIISHLCTSFYGCDSLVNVDLAILEPDAVIFPPPPLDCDLNLVVFLDGSSSSFNQAPGGNTTFLWTGPGVPPGTSQIGIAVDDPGQYCLTVSHTRGSVVCSETTCVTVTQNLNVPSPPTVTGSAAACTGTASGNYTVSPNGSVIPLNYTWTATGGGVITNVNATTASVVWQTAGSYQVCATSNNLCGSSNPACFNVTVSATPPTPQINGAATACAGGNSQVFSVSNALAGAMYTWTVPAGATFTGSGASISVNFGSVAPGTVQVCATAQNACGTSASGCASILITTAPPTPVLSGASSNCQGGAAATYTVTNSQAGVTYAWTAPPGATISGSGASISVNFTGASSGQVCVTASNGCGNASACLPVTVNTGPTATLSGSGEVCAGSGAAVPLTFVLTGTAPWVVVYSVNGQPQAPLNIASSPFILPGTTPGVCVPVSVTDATPCPGTVSGSATIIENPLPTAFLGGSGNICQGSGQSVQLSITLTGEAPWSVGWSSNGNPPSSLAISTSIFTLNIGQAQAGNISLTNVTDGNGCVGTVLGGATVGIFSAPTVADVVTACDATNTTFVTTFTISGGDASSYSVTPANGTLSGGTFTSNPITTGSGYSFVVSDANNCNPVTVDDPIVVCDCDTEVGSMSNLPQEVCGDGPVTAPYDNANQVFDGNDALVFVLHSANSFSITPPIIATTATPDVSFNPATMAYGTTYYLSAVVGDAAPGGVNLNDPCLKVAQGTPIVFYDIPNASLAGSTEVCDGETADLLITLEGSAPWTAMINGQSVSNIMTSPHTYTVTPAATTTYELTGVSDDHCPNSLSDSETITVHVPPTVANVGTTCNGSGTGFEVCFDILGGDPSCYLVDGAASGSTFCSPELPDGQGYSFSVSDCHGCPVVLVEDNLVDCSCLTVAGNFAPVSSDICGTDLAQPNYLGGEVLDTDDALCFVLHSGDPTQPIATNATGQFGFQTGMTYGQQYFICPVAGNDDGSGCVDFSDACFSIGACATVTFHDLPSAALGAGTDICTGEQATLTLTLTGVSPWTVVYDDGSGNVEVVNAFSSPFDFEVSPTVLTTYDLVSVDDAFCTGSVSAIDADVDVHAAPTIANLATTCNPAATAYVVTFNLVGGAPGSYAVTPAGTIAGNVFTSNPIPSGQAFAFSLDDANGCGPAETSGAKDCACITDAGDMPPSGTIEFCTDETASVPPAVNGNLDPDDTLIYVLHTGDGTTLGTVIATSPLPDFNYIPGVTLPGVIYFVSAVAGNDDGSGGVDVTDGCLDVAPGTPILFNELPEVSIAGDAGLCAGQSTDVTFSLTGEGPFSVNYESNGTAQSPLAVPTPGDFTQSLTPPVSLTLTLISVLDEGTGCENTSAESVTLTVNQPVEAGTPTGDVELCKNDAQSLDLDDYLTGATPGGVWLDFEDELVAGGIVDVSQTAPGDFIYTYTVDAVPPCADDSASFHVIIHPHPTADAGEDATLICAATETLLGGDGTTPDVTFDWSGNVSNPAAAHPTASSAGIYELTVTSAAGCTGTDEVEVSVAFDELFPHLSISDVSCFGESDGLISVDSITGGTMPFLCSFDGGAFVAQKDFLQLSAGMHEIIIRDANGCEKTLSFNIGEPEQVTVGIDGNFEGTDPIVELGDSLTLSLVTTPAFDSLDIVIWTSSTPIPCDTCQENQFLLTQQTSFSVMVSKDGCEAEDEMDVFVSKDRAVYVPNAFSPNGDLNNDVLQIFGGKSVVKVKSFLVFNRWGETVYEYYNFSPNDPLFGWNGLHRGKEMNPAVFVWFADVEFSDGQSRLFEGDVALLR